MCDIAKQLFQLKSKNPHTSCVTQESTFNNKESNISKTIPNIEIRRAEHKDTQKDSQPPIRNHAGHSFTRKVFWSASTNGHIKKTCKRQ